MRLLKARVALPQNAVTRLHSRSASLMRAPDPSAVCEQRFNDARRCDWFASVRDTLRDMAGQSRTCMFCDHNEPTDVEHFKPKVEFPGDTFSWTNMLWVCTTCNRLKGNKFPPHNCEGAPIIDPIVEEVWEYFLLDEFGNLIKRWDPDIDSFDVRAQSTCDYVYVDREEVQTRRQKRMKSLRLSVEQAIREFNDGIATIAVLNARVADWFAEPFQADVADFYLRGPGNVSEPFASLLALGLTVPPL